MRHTKYLLGGLCIISCFLSGCSILPTEEEFDAAPLVKKFDGGNFNKYTVTKGDMKSVEDIIAQYQGTTSSSITGEVVTDQIKKILVKKGQKVKSGQAIIKCYVAEEEAALKEAQRNVQKLSIQISHARQLSNAEVNKVKKTSKDKSQIKVIRAQYNAEIQGLQSQLQMARLDVDSAKEEMKDNTIKAESAGVVTYVNRALIGGYATESDKIITLRGKKKNRFKATSDNVDKLLEKKEVMVSVSGSQIKAKVVKGSEKRQVYFYPVNSVSLNNDVVGEVELILKEKKNVLSAPSALVYQMGEKNVVYVEGENGVKTMREVQVGEQIGSTIEIVSGLKEKEQIITN